MRSSSRVSGGRRVMISGLAIALVCSMAIGQEAPAEAQPPQPAAEHQWLGRFIGEWDVQTELTMQPGQPPVRMDGTETVRAVGPFWIIGESRSDAMDPPFVHVITIGFDAERQRFVATSVDSASSHLWTYEGNLDEQTGRMTLTWEGPCHMHEGRTMPFRGETWFENDDHRVFTAEVRGDDGEWTQIVISNIRRKN